MRLSRCLISDVGGGWGREIGDYCSFNSVEAILDNSTLASRGYFLLIDTDGSRRSLVNEAWLIKYPRYFENGPLEPGYDNRDENTKDSKTSQEPIKVCFFPLLQNCALGWVGTTKNPQIVLSSQRLYWLLRTYIQRYPGSEWYLLNYLQYQIIHWSTRTKSAMWPVLLRMRITISPQLLQQPWAAVSPLLGLIKFF